MTSSIQIKGNMGSRSFRIGTISATALQTSQDIDTGMGTVEYMTVQLTNTTTNETTPIVNESLPVSGKAVTVVVPPGTGTRTYNYFAVGRN